MYKKSYSPDHVRSVIRRHMIEFFFQFAEVTSKYLDGFWSNEEIDTTINVDNVEERCYLEVEEEVLNLSPNKNNHHSGCDVKFWSW